MNRPGLLFIFVIMVAGALWMLGNMIFTPKPPVNKPEPAPADPVVKKGDLLELVDQKKLVKVNAINGLDSAGKITVTGKNPPASGSHSAQLEKGASLTPFFMCSGPYSVESVLIEANGKSQKTETAKTLENGKEYEIRIKPDLSVEWTEQAAKSEETKSK